MLLGLLKLLIIMYSFILLIYIYIYSYILTIFFTERPILCVVTGLITMEPLICWT